MVARTDDKLHFTDEETENQLAVALVQYHRAGEESAKT